MTEYKISTRFGNFRVHFSKTGLAGVKFPARATGKAAKGRAASAEPSDRKTADWLKATRSSIFAALDGRTPKALPPLDISIGTDFQMSVWKALISIPAGETRSYAEIASQLGKPRAARAVGQACGANPVPLLIPCHRVLAADRKIGGFSGGLEWKRELLKIEGVSTD